MVMENDLSWIVPFGLGMLLFLAGIIYPVLKKGSKGKYLAAAGFEFAATFVMYVPVVLFTGFAEQWERLERPLQQFFRFAESVFTALVKSFSVGYERVDIEGHGLCSGIYSTAILLVNIVRFLFVAGLIIQFFDGPYQRIRLFFNRRRRIYLFSVCSDKTLAIAGSIRGRKKALVFASSGKELDSVKKEAVDGINGIRLGSSLPDVVKKIIRYAPKTEIFLFGEREEDNLAELDKVCGVTKPFPKARVRIYVELCETPWDAFDGYSEAYLLEQSRAFKGKKEKRSGSPGPENGEAEENFVINFVRSEENFAFNNLLKNSIFENAVERTEGVKDIRFLLLGMNERNLEMMKAVLHLSQMPGYRLTLMVLDASAKRAELRRKMPEIHNECGRVGDAVYKIIYRENVSFETDQFEEIVSKEFSDFTFAFINPGDDLMNASLAVRLNTLCYRNRRTDPYLIQVNA